MPLCCPGCRFDHFEAAHVWPERLGQAHTAILLLAIFQDGRHSPAGGQPGTIEGMGEGSLAAFGLIADASAPGLEIAAIGAG